MIDELCLQRRTHASLRHTFASRGLLVGEGLAMIGKLLGHNQIQTTARHAHLASDPILCDPLHFDGRTATRC